MAKSAMDEDPDEDGLEAEKVTNDSDLPEEIDKPFDPSKIKVGRRVVPINLIVERIKHDEIDLAPDFQRRARIWDNVRKSRLIESILLRIPLPVFYVAADIEENWKVVDGLQRLTTIFDFIDSDSDFGFALKGLEYLTPYEGVVFENLPRSIKRRINETELNINVIESGTPEEVMFNIFRRLNTGGLTLNSQEIRNALNPGPARTLLRELSQSQAFLNATDGSVSDARMAAQELVLRYYAFRNDDFITSSRGDLDSFLNEAMGRINTSKLSEINGIKNDFENAMKRSAKIFGNNAFRKISAGRTRRSPVNRALFEAWSVSLSKLSISDFKKLSARRDRVLDKFVNSIASDERFVQSISLSTASKRMVEIRFRKIQDLIYEVIHD